jgi:hypothetical protein
MMIKARRPSDRLGSIINQDVQAVVTLLNEIAEDFNTGDMPQVKPMDF